MSAPSREFNHATSALDSTNRSSDDDVKAEDDDDQRTIVFSTNVSLCTSNHGGPLLSSLAHVIACVLSSRLLVQISRNVPL